MVDNSKGEIIAIRVSVRKGMKENIASGYLRENHGFEGDIHGGPGERQVSLFTKESFDELKASGDKIGCAGFGENITVSGIRVGEIKPGTDMKAGNAVLKVTESGKICQKPCKFYKEEAKCRLPSLGIFAAVIKGGEIKTGDKIEVIDGV
ncbi:MOSC domain-containing protein [bacterium]|nr:MOSC domain-containing protein [bacterium]MBU3955763.1 MOSC domain-containing protein [bacterium]MBU4134675.1 MOSC domain-containing protein [bacterium]